MLRHCFLSVPFALFVYLPQLCNNLQCRTAPVVFWCVFHVRVLPITVRLSLFQRQQKPHSRIEPKTTAQRSQTLCLAPGTSHFVTLWRRLSGATRENVALHFCLLYVYVKSRSLLEPRQVIKYNMARRLYSQQSNMWIFEYNRLLRTAHLSSDDGNRVLSQTLCCFLNSDGP